MKAIALISGGLDSILAARMVKEQGVEVIPLNFTFPFCSRAKEGPIPKSDKFSLVREALGQDLMTTDISSEYLSLLNKPKHGFGSNLNPCIDCKILMLRKTKELMREWDASFAITGEVLAQRPMSQHRKALKIIEIESGLEGYLLRPLSAKMLEETIPEKEGWVRRDALLDFNGRSRKPQRALAQALSIVNYPNAAGGCLLTDPLFAQRLKDLIGHGELTLENVALLKIGRHFRISENAKLIVGRNEKENEELIKLSRKGDYLFSPPEDRAGPVSLARGGDISSDLIALCARITPMYCDENTLSESRILYKDVSAEDKDAPQKEYQALVVSGITKDELARLKI